MIDPTLMTGPAGESLRGMTRGGDGAADGGSGFLQRVARSLEELTGKTVSPDAVEDWLQGQGVPGFPTGDELAGLLDSMLPADGGALNAALSEGGQGDLDIAALLGAWAASSSTRLEGRPGVAAAASLTGALRADGGDMAEQLLAGLKASPRNGSVPDRAMAALADGGDGDPAAFRQALGAFTASGSAAGGRGAALLPPITQPVAQPGFGDAVGQRVTWMVRNEVQQARIQLNPPGLGPLEISVSLGEDKAHVGLTAHHALTRDALVADSSRLRAMLAESGFEQVDVDVSHREASSGGEHGGDGGDTRAGDGSRGPDGGAATTETVTVSRGNGLVDHYA